MMFTIKQLTAKGGADSFSPNSTTQSRVHALFIHDFCVSKAWGTTDDWLNNKRGNGYSRNENVGYYTKFKLELIK